MKKLSKEDKNRRDELIQKVRDLQAKLEDEITTVNAAIDKAQEVQSEYVEAVTELNGFREDIVSCMDDYFDERSAKWQESENGEAYSSWKSLWEEAENDAYFDEKQFDSIEVEFVALPDTIEELPETPE